jgi:hypothetical protein
LLIGFRQKQLANQNRKISKIQFHREVEALEPRLGEISWLSEKIAKSRGQMKISEILRNLKFQEI